MSLTDFFKAPKIGSLEHKVAEVFKEPPTLYSERLNFVKITPDYAEDMYEYSCDDDVTRYLTWSSHHSVKETERYATLLQKKYRSGVFNDWGLVLRETGKFIGTCGFTAFDFTEQSAEIGYVIAKPYWGMGLALEAAQRVMKFGIDELGLTGFCAKCIQGNDASFRVMQKCGMTTEGIYHNSMFIKGEYKTIIVCRATSSQILEKINEKENTHQ